MNRMTTSRANPDGPFLAAANGKTPAHRPAWIMRQAGRYLPEYRELRQEHSFIELCNSPSAAAEATMQPIRRFDFDAAILFTDLLIPIAAMGVDLRYEPGPVLGQTIDSMDDVEALSPLEPLKDLSPMLETVRRVRAELDEAKALIGFVGAPFTLSCYMIEGKGSKHWETTRRMIYQQPRVFAALLEKLADCLLPLVTALVEQGCDAVQVFDSWAGVLDPGCYAHFCAPQTDRLLQAAVDCGAVAINFATGSPQHLQRMTESPSQVLAIDWRLPMQAARTLAPERCLQGNLDPCTLFAPREDLRQAVRAVCHAAGPKNHIFNLGHGIQPITDPASLETVINAVRES